MGIRLILSIFLFLILVSSSFADCILTGPIQLDSPTGKEEGFGEMIFINNHTSVRLFYSIGANSAPSDPRTAYRDFNIQTKSWSPEVMLSTHKVGTRGLDIDGHLHFFYRQLTNNVFINITHAKSTDLTGSSWTTPDVVYAFTGGQAGNPDMGPAIATGNPNEFEIPFYYHVSQADGTWKIGVIKTTDRGNTWTAFPGTVYAGQQRLGEMSMQPIGNNRILALARDNVKTDGHLRQAFSLDKGATWSNFDDGYTNLGSNTEISMPWLLYDSLASRILVAYHDRGSQRTLISYGDPNFLINNPGSWPSPFVLASGYSFFGYPVMTRLTTDTYLITYTRDLTPGDNKTAKIFWLIFKVGDCVPNPNAVCQDGYCNFGETSADCPQDCAVTVTCPNGSCSGGETCETCQQDCGPCAIHCPDGNCNPNNENCVNCHEDCGECTNTTSGQITVEGVTLKDLGI